MDILYFKTKFLMALLICACLLHFNKKVTKKKVEITSQRLVGHMHPPRAFSGGFALVAVQSMRTRVHFPPEQSLPRYF